MEFNLEINNELNLHFKKNGVNLDIKNSDDINEIFKECLEDLNKFKIFLEFVLGKNIVDLNIKDEFGNYPLLQTCQHNDIEIVNLLIKCANKNDIILELNDKDEDENYPLLLACYENNIDIVHSLIDYANENNIILKLNDKDNDGYYPLLWACDDNNNIEMVQLLIDYANENNIILELNEKTNMGIIHC